MKLKLPLPDGPSVSALLDEPKIVRAAIALAHGAGAGMTHVFLAELTASLAKEGFAVLRYQFPYMEAKKRRTDSPKVATQTVAAAAQLLRSRFPAVPLFSGGKSYGARMTTTASAEGLLPREIRGIICFGFPLHPAGEPGIKRAEHLAKVGVPILFLQGTRDELADLSLMRGVCAKLPQARLHVVEGADHSFGVLKRSGRTDEEVMAELAREAAQALA